MILNNIIQRAKKKFLQIKEAYEFFDRKYNPTKYINQRSNYSFEDDESKPEKTSNEAFESIRERKKKNNENNNTSHTSM